MSTTTTNKNSKADEGKAPSAIDLIKASIFNADDLPYEDVPIEEWGVTLRIKGLSAGSRADFFLKGVSRSEAEEAKKSRLSPAVMVALSAHDPDTDERIFDPENEKELNQLLQKSAKIIERLNKIAMGLSGLLKDQTEEAAEHFRSED